MCVYLMTGRLKLYTGGVERREGGKRKAKKKRSEGAYLEKDKRGTIRRTTEKRK